MYRRRPRPPRDSAHADTSLDAVEYAEECLQKITHIGKFPPAYIYVERGIATWHQQDSAKLLHRLVIVITARHLLHSVDSSDFLLCT